MHDDAIAACKSGKTIAQIRDEYQEEVARWKRAIAALSERA